VLSPLISENNPRSRPAHFGPLLVAVNGVGGLLLKAIESGLAGGVTVMLQKLSFVASIGVGVPVMLAVAVPVEEIAFNTMFSKGLFASKSSLVPPVNQEYVSRPDEIFVIKGGMLPMVINGAAVWKSSLVESHLTVYWKEVISVKPLTAFTVSMVSSPHSTGFGSATKSSTRVETEGTVMVTDSVSVHPLRVTVTVYIVVLTGETVIESFVDII